MTQQQHFETASSRKQTDVGSGLLSLMMVMSINSILWATVWAYRVLSG